MAAKTAVLNRPPRPRTSRSRMLLVILGMLVGVEVGCGGDSTGPNHQATSQTYWTLQLNAHAVNMALTSPANVVHLRATALTVTGAPFTQTGRVMYSTVDSIISVDSTGLVTAHYATSGTPTQVIATLTEQGVTLADTARIQVDATPRALVKFSIHPLAGDSAKCALLITCSLPVLAMDAQGDTLSSEDINSILVAVTSSDPSKVTVDQSGNVSSHDVVTNDVFIIASTLAYGVAWRDSVRYTIGYPIFGLDVGLQAVYQVGSQTPAYVFSPLTETVGVGAIVTWFAGYATPNDVEFDDSATVQGISSADSTQYCLSINVCFLPVGAGGNIAPFKPTIVNDTIVSGTDRRYRRFPVAGTYSYHSRLLGSHGTIVVSADP